MNACLIKIIMETSIASRSDVVNLTININDNSFKRFKNIFTKYHDHIFSILYYIITIS